MLGSWKEWEKGDPLTINRIVWDGLEVANMQDVLDRDWFGIGKWGIELEAWIRKTVGVQFAQLTNSGSSAVLLAVQALVDSGKWKAGDHILHPACTFPTSINPAILFGMIPVFVDVEPGTYNINPRAFSRALKDMPEIKGAIVPHLLGNMTDIGLILDALDGRPLIEDCCDTIGSRWRGKHVGSFGTAGAFSFYASHHITTGGVGGAFVTNDEAMFRKVKSMTFWGRKLSPSVDLVTDFKNRYTYETIGHDMQMTELQAAFGYAQTSRIDQVISGRAARFDDLSRFFSGKWGKWFVLPQKHPKADPSWFGFPLEVRNEAPFTRDQLAKWLMDAKIEIRPLFAGNLTRQPAYEHIKCVVSGSLRQSDSNMVNALFLPAWGHMTKPQMEYLTKSLSAFLSRF